MKSVATLVLISTLAVGAWAAEPYGELPLGFEANQGQADLPVQFLSRGDGYVLFLTPTQAVLSLQPPTATSKKRQGARRVARVLRMKVVGADPRAKVEGRDRLPGVSNYFIGSDPAKWHIDVPTYARVYYRDIYENVDLAYYGNHRQLETDFVVAPGADPGVIALAFEGARTLAIDAAGALVLETGGGRVRLQKPAIYQWGHGERHPVAGRYALKRSGAVGFEVGAYDHSAPLVIDPVLVYSTYLGGTGNDTAYGIALDPLGNAYVTGDSASPNFPQLHANQVFSGGEDVFITKLNATGSALVYSTFLGGTAALEHGYDIAVDASGNAYVIGVTNSGDFPTTSNALQPAKQNGTNQDTAFVAKLDASGALAYSTYLSGTQFVSRGFGIATDGAGNAYATGQAGAGFPLTASAFSSASSNAGFLTKLDTNASGAASLLYSTFLGPAGFAEGRALAVDETGKAYVTGNTNSTSTNFTSPGAFQTVFGGGTADAFVAKFDTTLSGAASRIYSTYLGGSDQDFGGNAAARGSKAIAIDAAGNAYVTGQTRSTNFPTHDAVQPANAGYVDAFLTKLNPTGSALIYSTYLGGSNPSIADEGMAVAVNAAGNAYVTGRTQSVDFPTSSPLSIPGSTTGGVFVAKFSPVGDALVYSTRMGRVLVSSDEAGQGMALDDAGNAFVTGFARIEFPTVGAFQPSPGGGTDAFVTQIADPTIIGRVISRSGSGISGATVSLSGLPPQSTTTDASGYFTFGPLTISNSYTVSVSAPSYSFSPQTVSGLQKNVRLDFGRRTPFPDFDGDGKADVSVFRAGDWYVLRSFDGSLFHKTWGLPGDLIAPADYDGDGKTDVAVFRSGTWLVANSSNDQTSIVAFGAAGDLPVPGDFDGDGRADLSVFRPSTGAWLRINSSDNQPVTVIMGLNGDVPLIGDFDGDGRSDISYFRPSNGMWGILRSSDGTLLQVAFGISSDVPAPCDYDGDGKTDIAVYRPSSGTWSILYSGSAFASTIFGVLGDEPTSADFDGDGKADIAVFRPTSGSWFVSQSSGGLQVQQFGASGDQPIPLYFSRRAPVDTDGDGVPDAVDNCRYTANPSQADTGGIGTGSALDGIGDACQCGDVNGDGRVTLTDAVKIQRSLLNPPSATLERPELCDVGGPAGCSLSDAVILRRALLQPPTAFVQQVCAPAKP